MTYDALKRVSDAVATVLDALDVTVHKPIQGDATHKVIARAVLDTLQVRAPARPTLAETRTGHDWCPTCGEEVGTDRATLDGVERCALCGTALVPLPDAATDTLTKAAQVLHNSMCSGPACEDHCWDEAQSLADAGLLAVPAPAVDREGLTETLFEAIDDTDGVIDMCRRQADALISAGLIRESSLARGMADAAAGRVRRRDDFLDDEDGDSGEHRG